MREQYTWTHPSVLRLQDEAQGRDPLVEVVRRAERIALQAMENGWGGPPFDPFELADYLGVEVVGREDLEDARLISTGAGARIEFNPHRRPARVRFSLAHELAHMLFEDYGERVRYRGQSDRPTRTDEWQLEMLCNVAAAELIMPAGAIPDDQVRDLSLAHLLDLRQHLGVSTEALLRRVVKLSDDSVCMFTAARETAGDRFRLDYTVTSRAWSLGESTASTIPSDSVLRRCTAVGYSDSAVEAWGDQRVFVQAVGIPPYPGDRLPRIVGLLTPADPGAEREVGLHYVRGDATDPAIEGPTVIAHVVNDRAQRWSARGFAGALLRRYPSAGEQYCAWQSNDDNRALGNVHFGTIGDEVWIASLVAQAGYGDTRSGQPRLRVAALQDALSTLSDFAAAANATVHIPLIGTGQAGGSWPLIRDLVLSELVDQAVPVTVYVLPDESMPDELPEQLTII